VDELNDAVADLYQRRPSEFIAARTALARALRDAGRGDDAQAVQALRRPTVAAWALNRLCRTQRDRLSELLDLAGVLRQAQAQALAGQGAHELRQASQQRRELVEQLTDAALQELERLGTGNPEGSRAAVAATLEAALVDEQVAEHLRDCRLAREASPGAGFEEASLLRLVEEPSTPRGAGKAPAKRKTQPPSVAVAAQREAQERRKEAEKAQADARSAARQADEAAARVEQLRGELTAATSGAEAARRRAERAMRLAEDSTRVAERAEDRARQVTGSN
jgi:hypothetical protein